MESFVRVGLASLCVTLIASCGGGSDSATPTVGSVSTSSSVTPPPSPSAPAFAARQSAAVRLYEAVRISADLAASPLHFVVGADGKPWTTNGPCVFSSGSLQSTLDGSPVTPGSTLPTGSHRYAVVFTNCLVDGLAGTTFTGTNTVDYVTTDWKNVTASVRSDALRGYGLAFLSDLDDMSADGSGTWSRTTNADSTTYTYAPNSGFRVVNNRTTGVAIFNGGRYSMTTLAPPPGWSAAARFALDAVSVTINGIPFVLDGSLTAVYGSGGGQVTYAGEVRITSAGAFVGRLYSNASGALLVEEGPPLVAF